MTAAVHISKARMEGMRQWEKKSERKTRALYCQQGTKHHQNPDIAAQSQNEGSLMILLVQFKIIST